MELEKLDYELTVCKVASLQDLNPHMDFYFLGRTDEEISLVCPTPDAPEQATEREDGWKGFRIRGILDFSLTGVLAKLSAILAENRIGIFAVSTYNTDYILVKADSFDRAAEALVRAGYRFV